MPPTSRTQTQDEPDPRITKRKVVMRSIAAGPEEGIVLETVQTDYIREDVLDAFVAAVRPLWQQVTVADGYDAGPGGYDGATYVPPFVDHPLAHHFYPATSCKNCDHAPVDAEGRKAVVVRVDEEG